MNEATVTELGNSLSTRPDPVNPEDRKSYLHQWYLKHRKLMVERARRHRLDQRKNDPEGFLAQRRTQGRNYYRKNKDKLLHRRQVWWCKYRERNRARVRLYRLRHVESARQRVRVWYRNHPEKVRSNSAKRRAMERGSRVGNMVLITAWERRWRNRKTVRCYWCRGKFSPSECHTDHVVALANGGEHSVENLAISCSHCNLEKNSKRLDEWNQRLNQPVLL
jgi:5-methylcytosine-specific restriction endonuclease McrA